MAFVGARTPATTEPVSAEMSTEVPDGNILKGTELRRCRSVDWKSHSHFYNFLGKLIGNDFLHGSKPLVIGPDIQNLSMSQ